MTRRIGYKDELSQVNLMGMDIKPGLVPPPTVANNKA